MVKLMHRKILANQNVRNINKLRSVGLSQLSQINFQNGQKLSGTHQFCIMFFLGKG